MRIVPLIVAVAACVGMSARAHADDNFAAKAASAQRVTALDDLVWALTAACDKGDDVQQRQCRHTRDTRAAELTASPLLIDADPDAFAVGSWNAAKKSVDVSLAACVRCGGVKVEGKRWIVVGGKPGSPATIGSDGIAHGDTLYNTARAFADPAAAKKWTDALAHVRVQLLLQAAPKSAWHVGAADGVALAVVGYLVSNPCDGSVVIASPPMTEKVAIDKKACGK